MQLGVFVLKRLHVLFDGLFMDIDNPHFSDMCFSLAGEFHVTVIIKGAVRDFADQQNRIRCSERTRIIVITRAQNRNVELRFTVIVEANGVLDTDQAGVANLAR